MSLHLIDDKTLRLLIDAASWGVDSSSPHILEWQDAQMRAEEILKITAYEMFDARKDAD